VSRPSLPMRGVETSREKHRTQEEDRFKGIAFIGLRGFQRRLRLS
jgi:hypothetical protein